MKKLVLVLAIAMIFGVMTSQAMAGGPYTSTIDNDVYDSSPDAIPTPNDTAVDQNIHDAINLLLGTVHTKNEQVDSLQFTGPDRYWTDLSSSDFEGTYVTIGLTAANSNTLRVYDVTNPGTKIPVLGPFSGFTFLGDGTAANPFPASFSPFAGGTDFGWSLLSERDATSRVWDSDPVNNPDRLDHMMTYHLASLSGQTVYIITDTDEVIEYTFYDPYLIVWEDKPFDPQTGTLGDEDYNDIMFLVDRVRPIPEPLSLVLFGSGLIGLAGAFIRKK